MIAIHLVSFALLCDFISWREWSISKTLYTVTKPPFFFYPLPFYFLGLSFSFLFPSLIPLPSSSLPHFFLSFRVLLCSQAVPKLAIFPLQSLE